MHNIRSVYAWSSLLLNNLITFDLNIRRHETIVLYFVPSAIFQLNSASENKSIRRKFLKWI